MPPTTSQIGAWLRRERERQGAFTQEQAAHQLGVTERAVRKWEKGINAPPADKFLTLVRLYEAERRLPDLYKFDASSARARVRELPPGALVPVVRPSKDKKRGTG